MRSTIFERLSQTLTQTAITACMRQQTLQLFFFLAAGIKLEAKSNPSAFSSRPQQLPSGTLYEH